MDGHLLVDLLGAEELRELLDPDALADLELELQRLVDGRKARDVDEAHDLLRTLGPLSPTDIGHRSVSGADVAGWCATLVRERRAIQIRLADRDVLAASDDAARLRDALGVALPVGLPAVYTEAVDDPLGDLALRYAADPRPLPRARPGPLARHRR